ncbi:phosphoadenosine phosphosulfate reductase [Jimgerdemannia flammicorona]|uniref:Phosphoadenosine phosphosulfate reductase n=1 Tax=Jimgerdemannia flammicorona TaxID=994334 RepID=A0A433DG11_9FUNG|nr:phosphoadenosine phosphosulfate reductase [Jimgerdemannia flammicorona]
MSLKIVSKKVEREFHKNNKIVQSIITTPIMPSSTNTEQSNEPGRQSFAAFTPSHLKHLNYHLSKLPPKKILEWAILTLPNLYQTTAFGLTGCVIADMISKISIEQNDGKHLVPLIFLDTFYHFPETLDLANKFATHYNVPLKIYKPSGLATVGDLEREHGQRLWEVNEDMYDFLVKVEPARRAYAELDVAAVITGRRRSQKGDRAEIPIVEVDGTGMVKLNPLAYWDFQQVWTYIRANKVPYNALVDQGYKSIGDWHSTKAPVNGDDERSGRWDGKEKTECGLHKDYFKMRAAFIASKKKQQQQTKQGSGADLVAVE